MTGKPSSTPALMFQGTSSNAGKSVLTAAFCRMLLQDGFDPAPFKSQNMSLNSFVTPDGREIGRAQAVQARACRLEPDARMNPVLLKPSSDTGCQVLVMGRPVGSMRVKEYVDYKPRAFEAARAAYDSLAAEHRVMVLEGAGSPAEINLKAHDIVNMAMARHARARVLLVGDIDRGGVFAALAGTMALLEDWERDLVAGYVLNRFRGDASLLDPALEDISRRTGKPFLGVVPYLRDLGLPEEDSVSFKEAIGAGPRSNGAILDLALMDLPHISNFTDVDALRDEPDAGLRVVRHARELGEPDALILPGSKNTLGDLEHLRATGLARAVLDLAARGRTEIVGVCGGLQMLGRAVADPLGLESAHGVVPGLGLLDLETEMGREKTLRRTEGRHLEWDEPVAGYEIHHGRTVTGPGARESLRQDSGEPLGWSDASGLVWGTYLHGVFDRDGFRRRFLDRLRRRKGLDPLGRVAAPYDIEPALDRLADAVREHTDWRGIYGLLGLD